MSPRDFFDNVCRMRTAQRLYYLHRKDQDRANVQQLLNDAVQWEALIDKEITRVVQIIDKKENQKQ